MFFSTLKLYFGNVKWAWKLTAECLIVLPWVFIIQLTVSCLCESVRVTGTARKKVAHESLGATQLVLTLAACRWECIIITTWPHMLSHCCAPWVFHTWNVLLPGLEKACADTTSPHSNLKPSTQIILCIYFYFAETFEVCLRSVNEKNPLA